MNRDTLKILFSDCAARLIGQGITCYVSFFEGGAIQISARFAKSSVYLLCDKKGPSIRMYRNPNKTLPTEFFDTVDEAFQGFWSLVGQCQKGTV